MAQELSSQLGGAPPSFAALERLPYLEACVKEVLRLYPAIPMFPRVAASNDTLPSRHSVHAGELRGEGQPVAAGASPLPVTRPQAAPGSTTGSHLPSGWSPAAG